MVQTSTFLVITLQCYKQTIVIVEFSIANAVEFANDGLQSCLDEMTCDWIYDEDKMRIHLLKCFRNNC